MALSACLDSYENILDIKNSVSRLANMPEDTMGSVILSMQQITARLKTRLYGFESRKLAKVTELVKERNDNQRKKAEEASYRPALEEYARAHPADFSKREEARMRLNDVNKAIKELNDEKSALGMFSGKRKKQIEAELESLRNEMKDLEATIKKVKNDQEAYARRASKIAANKVDTLNVKLEPAECFVEYDIGIRIGSAPNAFDEFTDFAWKVLQIPLYRYNDQGEDGIVTIAKGFSYEYVTFLKEKLSDTNYEVVLSGGDYEHASEGLSVVVTSITDVASGDDDASAATKAATRRANVAERVAHYVPIDVEEYEARLMLPKTIATDLTTKTAYALAADLIEIGAEADIR